MVPFPGQLPINEAEQDILNIRKHGMLTRRIVVDTPMSRSLQVVLTVGN
jgi:hypothetical protein